MRHAFAADLFADSVESVGIGDHLIIDGGHLTVAPCQQQESVSGIRQRVHGSGKVSRNLAPVFHFSDAQVFVGRVTPRPSPRVEYWRRVLQP